MAFERLRIDKPLADHRAERRRFGLHSSHLAGHLHGIGGLAKRHGDIHFEIVVDAEQDALPDRGLETGRLDR